MKFNIGDKVSFLNEVGDGEVIEIISDYTIKVRHADGFDYNYRVDDVVRVMEVDYGEVKAKDSAVRSHKPISKKHTSGSIMEVDLHMIELVDDHRNMTNHEIVVHQMQVFEQKLHEAMNNGYSRVVFIHGVGEGRLKAEIHNRLRTNYHELEYYDGSYKKYGQGATEIRLL